MSGSQTIVDFAEIPNDWRVPSTLVEVRPSYANVGVLPYPAKLLIMGPMLTAVGTADPLRTYQLTRPDQANALFGRGSILARMVQAAMAANGTTPVFAMGRGDPSGAAATGGWTFAGTPTANGQAAVGIGGERVAVPVLVTDTPTSMALKLRDAINAKLDLPVTAAASTGTVTVTCRHVGAIGNELPLQMNPSSDDSLPPGLTMTMTAMASGTGTVDISTALSVIAADWYTDIVSAYTDVTNMALLEADLARRYAASGRLDAHGWIARGGTFGTLSAFGVTRNSPFVTCLGLRGIVAEPWRAAAVLAAVGVFHLTNDPSRQLRGLALPGIAPPPPSGRFTDTERDLLLRDGISTFTVTEDGTVVLERVITMYQKTNLGADDTAWLDVMVPRTLSRIRYDWRNFVTLNYPRHKLADDGALAAQFSDVVVTPRILQSAWAGRLRLYEEQAWIEGSAESARASVFLRDGTDRNRVNARQEVRIIGNLMTLAVALEFEA